MISQKEYFPGARKDFGKKEKLSPAEEVALLEIERESINKILDEHGL